MGTVDNLYLRPEDLIGVYDDAEGVCRVETPEEPPSTCKVPPLEPEGARAASVELEAMRARESRPTGPPEKDPASWAKYRDLVDTDPTKTDVKSRLASLLAIRRAALAADDGRLARLCQSTAARYVKFAMEHGMDKDDLRTVASKLSIFLPKVKGITMQVGNIASNYSPGSAAAKIWAKVGADTDEHDALFTETPVTVLPHKQPLKGGLERQMLRLEDKEYPDNPIGSLIRVPAGASVRAGYVVVKTSHEDAGRRGYALFAAANYSIDETRPATVSIVRGGTQNLYVVPDMDGIVVMRDGKPEILNARNEDIFQLMDDTMDSEGTMFQTNLLIFEGKNIVPEKGTGEDKDQRRLLVTFDDGSYGIVEIHEYVDFYEAAQMVTKIPGLKSAVNLDTGGSDVAGYTTLRGEVVFTGETEDFGGDTSTATVFYVK